MGLPGAYRSLARTGETLVYLVDPGVGAADVCGSAAAHRLGNLSWSNGVGRATLGVPSVPAGVYTFRAQTPDTVCSNIGSNDGPLTFEVVEPQDRSPPWILAVAVAIGGVLLVLVRRQMVR